MRRQKTQTHTQTHKMVQTARKHMEIYTELSDCVFQQYLKVEEGDPCISNDIPFDANEKILISKVAKVVYNMLKIKYPGKTDAEYILIAWDNAIFRQYCTKFGDNFE